MKKHFLKIIQILLGSRVVKFVFIISIWIITLKVLSLFGLIDKIDSNVLLFAHLAVFFFALTASPTTWVIKGPLGFEAGSNDPKHTHITFNENSHDGQIDIREYGEKEKEQKHITELANQIKKK